jgi:hypothetical protein
MSFNKPAEFLAQKAGMIRQIRFGSDCAKGADQQFQIFGRYSDDIPISVQLAVKTVFLLLYSHEHNLIITVWKAFLELWSEEILAGSLHCISLFLFLFVFSCFSQVDSHPDCSAQGAVDVGEGSRADVIGLAWFQHVPTIRGKEIVASTCQKIKDKRRGGKWSQHESTMVVAKVTTKKRDRC